MSKAPYKTKQMAELLTFLESVQGKHVTVNEICDYFKEKEYRLERQRYIVIWKNGKRGSGRKVCCRRNQQCMF